MNGLSNSIAKIIHPCEVWMGMLNVKTKRKKIIIVHEQYKMGLVCICVNKILFQSVV